MASEHCEVVEDDSDGCGEFLSEDFVSSHVEDLHVVEADRDKVDEFQSEESLDELAKVILESSLLLLADTTRHRQERMRAGWKTCVEGGGEREREREGGAMNEKLMELRMSSPPPLT